MQDGLMILGFHSSSPAVVRPTIVSGATASPALLSESVLRAWVHLAKRFFLASSLAVVSASMLAATPPNTAVTNTATANYTIGGTAAVVSGSVTVTTAKRTPASIQFLQYIPQGTGGSLETVATTQCNGQPMPAPNAFTPTATPLDVPGQLRLAPAKEYVKGDALFVKVTDYDQNLDAFVAETIQVKMSSGTNGAIDSETLTLTETGPSTGVFIGYIQSKARTPASPGAANDCQLTILGVNSPVQANYTDALDVVPTVAGSALIDPFGLLFNSISGVGVDGGIVFMMNMATGLPATVYCDDGVTVLPQPITTGSPTVCDPTVAAGSYRFPRAAPGNYRFLIVPPQGFAYPSTVPVASLPPGFVIDGTLAGNGASYGGRFALNLGPDLHIDTPVDPSSGNLQIIKTTAKTIVGEGEFVPYTLSIKNVSTVNALAVMIADQLPLGFRYRAGSARLNAALLANPSISTDGRTLTFNLGNLAASASTELKYVVEVTPQAKAGKAENVAFATGGHRSNTARATILVREDLMRSKTILIGTVYDGACNSEPAKGMPNVRIVLENGATVLTDSNGQWHIDNMIPGTHVVQLDKDSLPKNYAVLDCQPNNRFAGRSDAQFVNVRGGSLWRANFYVQSNAQNTDQSVQATNPSNTASTPVAGKQAPRQLVEKLPYDSDWLAAAQEGPQWLHPQKGFSPALPVIKFAVKHGLNDQVKIKMNGQDVGGYNYDGTQINAKNKVTLSLWSAVPLLDNENQLEITVTSPSGLVVLEEKRSIYYSEAPVKAQLMTAKSKLVADGKTQAIVAVRFLDRNNRPARRGINGEFQLNTPYESATQQETIRQDSLSGSANNKPSFEIADDGIAYIRLAPTTQSGEVVLNFDFGQNKLSASTAQGALSNDQQVRAWLVPGQRDWILVGFAQGTIGYKALSGNVQGAKDAKADDDLFDQNRVAFYAKGTIDSNTLLTIAYDSAKPRSDLGANASLKQAVEPDKFYTLYADATQTYFDAASARKLYLKVERSQFYALFGDFDTGLSVTEFARYNRSFNGIKSEYKGEQFSYTAFAAMTAQAFKKDEIQGNGTSGTYRLSSGQILANSEKIRIETRDRLRSEVLLKTETLVRYIDYNIDYVQGTVFFNKPVSSFDFKLNPITILVEYEAGDSNDEKLTAGGRAAVKMNDAALIGVTAVREGNVGAKGELYGVDLSLQLDAKTKAVLEYAQSKHESSSGIAKGNAWKAELLHSDLTLDAKAYIREQGSGFGLNQQAGSESGTRKAGIEARYKFNPSLSILAQVYQQSNLGNASEQQVAEARVDQKLSVQSDVFFGARAVRETSATGQDRSNNQFIGGASYAVTDTPVTIKATTELNASNEQQSSDFPNRYVVGADYKLNERTDLFTQFEWARGSVVSSKTSVLGFRVKPWSGAEAAAKIGSAGSTDGQRVYSDIGLTQRWQLDEHWLADVAAQRVQVLKAANPSGLATSSSVVSGNSTALSAGLAYSEKKWSANSRLEVSSGADSNTNLLLGAQRSLDNGLMIATGLSHRRAETGTTNTRNTLARLSLARRPLSSDWSWLNRLDFIDESTSSTSAGGSNIRVKKWVNSTHLNWSPSRHTQWSFQYAGKYVLDTLDGTAYRGYTDLMGAEVHRDLTGDLRSWDVGAHAARLHSYGSPSDQLSAGVSIGYKLTHNAWLSLGYNAVGFKDGDFSGANYRTKGAYLTLRIKADQDSFNLNRNRVNPLILPQ